MELNKRYGESDTKKEIYTEIASGDNRTEQDRIYETLQHGTGELADNTTPSTKKCTPLLLWCTLVNSILIGLLIIAVSVSSYMFINVSKASNSKGATVTGIWTNWSDWSPCNAKCGQGFKWRMRTCTSVSPIDNGFGCNGNGTETVQCQNRECFADLQKLVTTLSQKINKIEHAQGQIQTEVLQNTNRLNKTKVSVGFAVSYPDNSSGSPLKFKQVIYNTGDDYNESSGVFTCRHPGLYFFTATLFRSPGFRDSGCVFHVNGIYKLTVNSDTGANDGYQSGSASLVYRLNAGDIVELSHCKGQDHMYKFSSFTGFRVSY